MRKLSCLIICIFLLNCLAGCATYESAYSSYSVAQSMIAHASGPIVTFHENGQLASVGNPMIPLMGMQMKGPKSDWDGFWDVLRMAVPFAAIWGVVGSMANATHGNTTNVSGTHNYTGNTATGSPSNWGSPPTTNTINNFLPNEIIIE